MHALPHVALAVRQETEGAATLVRMHSFGNQRFVQLWRNKTQHGISRIFCDYGATPGKIIKQTLSSTDVRENNFLKKSAPVLFK